jgi:arylsulfatase A-like enzyme
MSVLLITTDQQRADSIGAYGNPVCATPAIDALAAAGTRYTFAHTQNPYCQPSRATILTGTYPSTHGVVSNGVDLPERAATSSVATHFTRAGHRTAYFGKAHFASTYPLLPTGRLESVEGSALMPDDWHGPYFGFDHCELILFGHMLRMAPLMGRWNWCYGPPPFGLHYARYLFRDGHERGVERLRRMQPEAAGRVWYHTQTWANAIDEEDHPTTWVADRAVDWLAKAREPFFAWVSFTDPHHPMDPPAPWSEMYDAADVTQMLPVSPPGELDAKPAIHKAWAEGQPNGPMEWANPGGVHLTRQELATMIAGYYGMVTQLDAAIGRVVAAAPPDTTVIFTSDHGDFLGDHSMLFKGPLHYEGLLRVPLIVRGEGYTPGAVVGDPVGTIDIAPTALATAGIDLPQDMEGAVLPSTDGSRQHVLTENDHQMVFRLPLRTIATKQWKVTRYESVPGTGELYDLIDDPGEVVNRWDDPACAGARADMLGLLDEVMNHETHAEPMVGVVG